MIHHAHLGQQVATGDPILGISGLQFYVSTAYPSSIVSSGGLVSEWQDQSGNGIDATESTNKPQVVAGVLNGKSVIRFDGVNDVLTLDSQPITGSIARTAIIVAKSDNTGIQAPMLSLSSQTATNGGNWRFTSEVALRIKSGFREFAGNGGGSYKVMVIAHGDSENVTDAVCYINGSLQSNGSAFSQNIDTVAGTARIGKYDTDYYDGDIAAIALWDKKLSTAERQAVESYFGNVFGITI